MFASILPSTVVAVECRDDPAEATLFPEEQAAIANAVEKRRREFTTVRHCARLAMTQLGVPPAPLLPGAKRAPIWPDRVVGSMTHCLGYRAAAVALADDMLSVGIDAEPSGPLPDGVEHLIASPAEQDQLRSLAARDPLIHWGRVLFSAKESVYKTWFPLTGRWLGFEDASLTIDPAGTFSARLLVNGPELEGSELTVFNGRWLVREGFTMTAIALPKTN